jgi:L-fuculose-phosphate aldolase
LHMKFEKERREICDIAKLMFERKLTNIAGGNISVKIDDNKYLMTPSLMSEEKYCKINPGDILVVNNDMEIIDGEGKITRESNMHMGVYKNLPLAGAIIHAHPQNVLAFACLGIPLPSLTEGTDKYGEMITLPYAKTCSQELADIAVSYLVTRNYELSSHSLVTLLRRHGVLIVDKNIKKALDALERVETNAYVNIHAKILAQ